MTRGEGGDGPGGEGTVGGCCVAHMVLYCEFCLAQGQRLGHCTLLLDHHPGAKIMKLC